MAVMRVDFETLLDFDSNAAVLLLFFFPIVAAVIVVTRKNPRRFLYIYATLNSSSYKPVLVFHHLPNFVGFLLLCVFVGLVSCRHQDGWINITQSDNHCGLYTCKGTERRRESNSCAAATTSRDVMQQYIVLFLCPFLIVSIFDSDMVFLFFTLNCWPNEYLVVFFCRHH
jgi:hypothetical protein